MAGEVVEEEETASAASVAGGMVEEAPVAVGVVEEEEMVLAASAVVGVDGEEGSTALVDLSGMHSNWHVYPSQPVPVHNVCPNRPVHVHTHPSRPCADLIGFAARRQRRAGEAADASTRTW